MSGDGGGDLTPDGGPDGGPAGGRFVGRTHRYPLRVYYEDTDAGGIVYHASYLRFAERARSEMMRGLGCAPAALAARTGVAFAVRRLTIDYRRPAVLDDALEVRTQIVNMCGATLTLEQTLFRQETGLATLAVVVFCLGPGGRPVRLPAEVRAAAGPFLPPALPEGPVGASRRARVGS